MGLAELEAVLGGATSSDLLLFTANWSFLVHSNRSHGSSGSGGKKGGSDLPPTRAGGQDDGSLRQTPSK